MTSRPVAYLFFIATILHGGHTFCPDGFPCTCESRGDMFRAINCIGRGLTTMPDFSEVDRNASIQSINLMDNKLTRIPNSTFDDLSVFSVIMDNNPIEDISPFAFKGVKDLATLSLSNCTLTSCPVLKSADMTNLTSLTLSANKITTIADDVFADPPPLKLLSLRGNQLKLGNLSENTFARLGSTLERIDLSGAGLAEIPQKLFAPLQKLRVIKLQDNMLGSVDALAAAKYSGEKILKKSSYNFKNNQLNSISPKVFLNRPTPTTIDVSNNNLTTLDFLADYCFFEGAEVVAYGNPINCDCALYNVLKAQTLAVLGECASPAEYKSAKLPPVYAEGFFLQAAMATCKGADEEFRRYDCTCNTWRNFTTFQEERGKCVTMGSGIVKPSWAFLVNISVIFAMVLMK
ncbi:leucine-rich repeat-containing G-protein coupled receptor 4-like [Lineus longissimus]|uniref:leucine-rich repeat-containing G-protein coupled receptor 4-like n=1 Tax=Lineus longissimus TaxID=88925 RepID=UPI00315D5E2B